MATRQRNGARAIREIDLYGFYAEPDIYGNGHYARVKAIMDRWCLGDVMDNWNFPYVSNFPPSNLEGIKRPHIAITDHFNWEVTRGDATLAVFAIDDIGYNRDVNSADVIINIGRSTPFGRGAASRNQYWGGLKYWTARKRLVEYRESEDWSKPIMRGDTIAIIPGSAAFIDKKIIGVMDTYAEAFGYNTQVLRNMKFTDYAEALRAATIVVSPASNSALEALYLGKPLLVLQTANNQFYYYQNLLLSELALPFTLKNLVRLMEDRQKRFSMGARGYKEVEGNGIDYIEQEATWRHSLQQ